MADSKKDELVRFLEERAFKPVLNAKPKGRSEAEQKKPKGDARRNRAVPQLRLGAGSRDEFQARPRFGAGQADPCRAAFAGSADDKRPP